MQRETKKWRKGGSGSEKRAEGGTLGNKQAGPPRPALSSVARGCRDSASVNAHDRVRAWRSRSWALLHPRSVRSCSFSSDTSAHPSSVRHPLTEFAFLCVFFACVAGSHRRSVPPRLRSLVSSLDGVVRWRSHTDDGPAHMHALPTHKGATSTNTHIHAYTHSHIDTHA